MHCNHEFQEKLRKKLFWSLTDLILTPMQCSLSEATGCSRLMWLKACAESVSLHIQWPIVEGGRTSEQTNSAWHLPSWPLPSSLRRRTRAPALKKVSFSSSPHSPVIYQQSQLKAKQYQKLLLSFFPTIHPHTLTTADRTGFFTFWAVFNHTIP